jgi:hypothetical protein
VAVEPPVDSSREWIAPIVTTPVGGYVRLSHPTRHQLSKLFQPYYYALGSEKAIEDVCSQCTHCTTLASKPKAVQGASAPTPPRKPGERFGADVLCRERQRMKPEDIHDPEPTCDTFNPEPRHSTPVDDLPNADPSESLPHDADAGPAASVSQRPKRVVKKPAYLKDYVT